eukprot:6855052-Prorocentrum_lima.AAC.1
MIGQSSSSSSSTRTSNNYSTMVTYAINVETIDSSVVTLQLSVPVDDSAVHPYQHQYGRPAASRQLNPIMLISERSALQAELILNTRDRNVDLARVFA